MSVSEVMNQSAGGTLVITMDCTMKHEETRAIESFRDHYGKRGIVIHGTLAKYKNNDNSLIKRVCCMSLEGDGTQDAKAALFNLDVTCKCAKQEQTWNNMHNSNL